MTVGRNSSSLHIKNMVCARCIRVVREELENLGLEVMDIQLGKVKIASVIKGKMKARIKQVLKKNGFELLTDRNAQLVELVKTEIIKLIYSTELEQGSVTLSSQLTILGRDYSSLSKLFSSVEGTTIEQFYILHKIERVKELLIYDELTLSEISWRLGYSSVQHLSNQFKKLTGLSPSYFKNIKSERKQLDKISLSGKL